MASELIFRNFPKRSAIAYQLSVTNHQSSVTGEQSAISHEQSTINPIIIY
ncbi:hypothetical protein [Hyella patelloides]|nr:hypothetical protein [Hyella patelloides]